VHRRTARGNRIGLTVLGLVLLAGAAALFGARLGWYGTSGKRARVYPGSAAGFVRDNGDWLWPVAAAVAILLGLLFLRWLLVQSRTDTVRRVVADTDADGADSGRTLLAAGAVTDAVQDDVAGVRGVRRARATLTGPRDAPTLWLAVTTTADADLGRLRRHLAATTLPDVRAALEQPDLPVQVTVAVGTSAAGREVR
jgi:hypothetical protein